MATGIPSSSKSSTIMRYEKVFSVLTKYGFEDVLAHPPFNKIVPQANFLVPKRNGKKVSQFSRYERIRLVCEELGTTFIKFAQVASNRPDVLPQELIVELEKLQDHAPKVPQADIAACIEAEYERPLSEFLTFFNEDPLASASMAQVHRGTLLGGQEVVLKIQRPGIRSTISSDLKILKNLVSVIESYFPSYSVYQPGELVKMFERSITEELSFERELENLEVFRNNFQNNPAVLIPKAYKELCTDSILCMEYVDGFKINDLTSLSQCGLSPKAIVGKGVELYFQQIFEYGFFHADPHPGNIFVVKDGRISFIDYGMMGTLIKSDQILFGKILFSIHQNDVKSLKKVILSMTSELDSDQERELEYDLTHLLRQYSKARLTDMNASEVFRGFNILFYEYKIKIPFNLLLLLKALVILEGVTRVLDPDYNIIENVAPYVRKLMNQASNPTMLKAEIGSSLLSLKDFASDLPEDLREIVKKVKKGKLHVEFEHKGLEPLMKSFDSGIRILSNAIVLLAIILASTQLVSANVGPLVEGVSIMGIVGYCVSVFIGLRITLLIYRSRK